MKPNLLFPLTATVQADWNLSTALDPDTGRLTMQSPLPSPLPNVETRFQGAVRADSGHCQLCKTKIKHQFFVHSEVAEVSAIVGSDCIEKFMSERDAYAVQRLLKQMKEAHKRLELANKAKAYVVLQELCAEVVKKLPAFGRWDDSIPNCVHATVRNARGLTYQKHGVTMPTKFVELADALRDLEQTRDWLAIN